MFGFFFCLFDIRDSDKSARGIFSYSQTELVKKIKNDVKNIKYFITLYFYIKSTAAADVRLQYTRAAYYWH